MPRHFALSRSTALAVVLLAQTAVAQAIPADQARHLLQRTGFQPTGQDIQALEPLTQAQAAQRLVSEARLRSRAASVPPIWADEAPEPRPKGPLSEAQRKAYFGKLADRAVELQAWWFGEMLTTPAPLAERMTLFWHNHFTSAVQKVNAPQLMYRQNLLLRAGALGNFGKLLHALARDPAMLIYLDSARNRKGQPNENFARELLELFTLGEGHYTEADIREAARAFTGWTVQPPQSSFTIDPRQHDAGPKRFMGQTGPFGGDEILDIVLAQPRTAEYIVEKLWREFVSPTPDPAAVKRLAAGFRKDYEVAPLMVALLTEPAFTTPGNRALLVKSPVEFVVGTARILELPLPPAGAALAASTMGQTVFNPPNVKGWPGGEDWITTETLIARRQFLEYLMGDRLRLAAPKQFQGREVPAIYREMHAKQRAMASQIGRFAESQPLDPLLPVLLPLEPVMPPVEGAKPPERLQTWLLDPVYNLK